MGNSDIRDIATISEIGVEEVKGRTVTVDAYNWLYKYMITTTRYTDRGSYTTEDGEEYPILIGAVMGLKKFFYRNMTPIFVFDGGYHDLKVEELERREERRTEYSSMAKEHRDKGNKIKAKIHESRSKKLTDEMLSATIELFKILDIPYLIAPEAGESQAAHMARESNQIYGVISDDYDSLLFASPITIRNFTSSSRELEKMDYERTLAETSLTREQLIDSVILCGTDYNDGVHGYGPKTSVSKIREHGDIYNLMEEEGIEIENIDTIREIFLSPTVTDDYEVPTGSLNPDTEEARNFLVNEKEIEESEIDSNLEYIDDQTTRPDITDW